MEPFRFDRISKALARRRLSRRDALARGGIGLAAAGAASAAGISAAAAQDATPVAEPAPSPHAPEMLFVQTYQSGTISPVEGAEGRYTLTLEAGTGQTVYFSDRPDRIVGANPTPQFLEGLGFYPDNPPNAALVVETAPGETDIAVVELFDPLYDPVSQGVTYEVEVLANWQAELEMGFHEAPTDLAALAPSFGAAHLFIDGFLCPGSSTPILCTDNHHFTVYGSINHSGYCQHYLPPFGCWPCEPWLLEAEAERYWANECQKLYPDCGRDRESSYCAPLNVCYGGDYGPCNQAFGYPVDGS